MKEIQDQIFNLNKHVFIRQAVIARCEYEHKQNKEKRPFRKFRQTRNVDTTMILSCKNLDGIICEHILRYILNSFRWSFVPIDRSIQVQLVGVRSEFIVRVDESSELHIWQL